MGPGSGGGLGGRGLGRRDRRRGVGAGAGAGHGGVVGRATGGLGARSWPGPRGAQGFGELGASLTQGPWSQMIRPIAPSRMRFPSAGRHLVNTVPTRGLYLSFVLVVVEGVT